MKMVGVLLLVLALIAGTVGCPATPPTDPEPTLPIQYNLTISSTAGGSVTTPGEGAFNYDEGDVVDLVADAEEGYEFVEWTGGVDTITDVNASSSTITINGDYEITANFERVYELTISSTAGGSVTTPGEGSFLYSAGTVVSLVASPASGYGFVNWTGDVDTIPDVTAGSTTITLDGDYAITASFEPEEEEDTVYFADPKLEAVIRTRIAKPEAPIHPSDLEGLRTLIAGHRDISDLTGLEYCTDLVVLYLEDNQISGISPLANLTDLQGLYLWGNQISDISPLANLTNLTQLQLRSNQINDIEPLLENEGLSIEYWVDLRENPLSSDSIHIHIPELDARGVTVYFDEPGAPDFGSGTPEDYDTLQEFFDFYGYGLDIASDELGIERFPPGAVRVTVLNGHYEYDNPTGWYTDEEQTYVLFPGRPAVGDTALWVSSEPFGFFIDSDAGRFYTEIGRNPDGFDHALVYRNTKGPGYIVAFEDLWGGGDMNYTDRILEVEIVSIAP